MCGYFKFRIFKLEMMYINKILVINFINFWFMKFFYELELNLFIFCLFFIDMVVNINKCIIIICLLFVNV